MTPPDALPVLIVGAGPSGLLLALELCRHGVRPRVMDALPGPSPLSRAAPARCGISLTKSELFDKIAAF